MVLALLAIPPELSSLFMAGDKPNKVIIMNFIFRKAFISTASCLLFSIAPSSAFAAPGTLSTTPLFVSNAIEPNIFFTLDDSGSMGWEAMVEDGTAGYTTDGGRPIVNGFTKEYFNPTWETDCNVIEPENIDPHAWVFRTHHGNHNYYNPGTTYVPWAGTNNDGSPMYEDADPTSIPEYPYWTTGDNVDITVKHDFYEYPFGNCWATATEHQGIFYIPTYAVWDDTDGDGIIETTDDHTMVEIVAGTDEMQNFANWFMYYRTREFAAKAAIGAVINNSDATRMGLDVFNAEHQEDLSSMTDPANKRGMLKTFYNVWSSGGTPARRAMKRVGDRFARTSGTMPILSKEKGGECQQNFNILLSDGFWNGSSPGLGNTDQSASADGGFDGDETESNDGGNYEDSYSNTLADVAMYYYEKDLRNDLNDYVPTQEGVDMAEHQHLVSYTISFGLTGTLDAETDNPLDADFAWPDAHDGDDEKVDDLWHAAYNGRGKYLSASNPEELEESLGKAIDDIAERTATAAAASVTSAELTTDSIVYLSEFNTNRWQGTIYAYKIAELESGGSLSSTPAWSASDILENRDLANSPRVILTYDDVTSHDGIAFQWDDITTAMKSDLKTSSVGGTDSDAIAEARLDYLRGSRVNEGSGYTFRERATLLGDIVHSGPVYVEKSSLRWPDEAPYPTDANAYSEFKETTENRSGTIYVGANDGMIHAFDGDSGDELLAYIPSNLFSTSSAKGLHYLTHDSYVHNYYNDLTPAVSDVYINTGSGSSSWRTILMSGQRAGGRGYSALDITDPGAFSEANAEKLVLWEFNEGDDADLGYTFSRPQIGMANDGTWVAIFGNGYNNTGSGKAALFIVKIEAGIDGAWSTSDYTKIEADLGEGTNGLGTPSLADLDGNGTIDRAYAGDLFGNLWVFDLTSAASGSWGLAYTKPLFKTTDPLPITSKPSLSLHPEIDSGSTNTPNIMVAFGSGQYMVESDKTSTNDNYFYGVWDKGDSNLDRSDLVAQTFRTDVGDHRVLTQNSVDYNTKYGWHISLDDSGERVITNPIVRSNIVFFNSAVPTSDACAVGGYSYRFAVDLATGGTPDSPVIDVNGDGVVDAKDSITGVSGGDVASAIRHDRLLTDDTITEKHLINDKDITAIKEAPERETGRLSWQELLK